MTEETPKGYLAKYGSRLIDAGYRIVPIPKGDKSPPKDKDFGDWNKVKSTQSNLRAWVEGSYSRSGIGVITKNAPGVDLDIMDSDAVQYMKTWVFDRLGLAPVRIGQAPKALLAFRCDSPFPKITSKFWVDDFCTILGKDGLTKPYRVEILADGQQYVAYHTHPDTGQPYRWTENGSILKIARDDLPLITQDDAQAICDEFDRFAESQGWEVKANTARISRLKALNGKNIDKNDIFATDKQKTDIAESELSRKLMLVPGSENYETWVQIGMALWHQFDGEQQGLDMWHEWSCQATNYDSAACDEKWESFDAQGKSQTPLTARIIIKLADEQIKVIKVETYRELLEKIAYADSTDKLKEVCDQIKQTEFQVMEREVLADRVKGAYKRITNAVMGIGTARGLIRYEEPPGKELPRWLTGWVYIKKDNTFYNTKTRETINVQAFNDAFNRNMLTRVERAEGKSTPETQAATFALNSAEVETFSNRMYYPGEEDFFSYNSLRYVNSYNANNIPDVPEKLSRREREAVDFAKGHLENLFPGDRVLLDALAWIIQNPGKRLNWALLLQGTEGDGKSYVAGLLGACLGPDNVQNLQPTSLEEKYTSWAEGAQVAFFEEVKLHGHNRFDVLNKVKPLITNVMVSIRRMNVDVYQVVNMTNYIFTTNFPDALPLNDNDTRYYILFSRFQTKTAIKAFELANPGYFDKLYATLEHGGALRKWLLSHVVPETFQPYGRAPFSKHKAEMVSYVEKEDTAGLKEILAGQTGGLDETLLNVTELAEAMSTLDMDVPYGRAMSQLLVDNGFRRLGKVRIGKDTPVWWSRNPELFRHKDGSTNIPELKDYRATGGL